MTAVEKREIRDDSTFRRLIELQIDEIRARDGMIAELSELLERQATELTSARKELNACKARLAMAAA